MIHFFPTFSADACDSPFARELNALRVEYRLFPARIVLRYRHRIWLLLRGWPTLIGFALRSAFRSLWSHPEPDAVVLGSHIEVLAFFAVSCLRMRKRPQIVLLGFILTRRKQAWANRLRQAYFRLIFSIADRVLCHSQLEARRYAGLFGGSRARFIHIPYGLHIDGREAPRESASAVPSLPRILSAGRSGRDYRTLFEAVATLPVQLRVVCDNAAALAGLTLPANVTVLRDCYDDAYVDEIRNAWLVAIPLGVADISAGQMVLLQAMAFGKPTVITRTPTVEDYVSDGVESLLVEQGSVEEVREAISRLINDAAFSRTLGSNAEKAFDERFSMKAYVRNLVASVSQPVG